MARFAPGDVVAHNGRPAKVAAAFEADGSTRYHIFYTDGSGEACFDLLGRVLDSAEQVYERLVRENIYEPGKHTSAELEPWLNAAREAQR